VSRGGGQRHRAASVVADDEPALQWELLLCGHSGDYGQPGRGDCGAEPADAHLREPLSPRTCTPHGLALGPHPFAIVGCNDPTHSFIMNITTGAVIEIPQVGGSDEVWYNPGDNRYYLGASANTRTLAGVVGTTLNPVLGIVDAGANTWIASVPTA